jgi:DNA ligase-1
LVNLIDLARLVDELRALSRTLDRRATLARFLASMDDDADLAAAIRFVEGKPFGATDERTLGAGGAMLIEVALPIIGLDERAFRAVAIAQGEIGEALRATWPRSSTCPTLTLANVVEAFDKIASSSAAQKRSILAGLLSDCIDPGEACLLAKIILGDMRSGVGAGLIVPAVAQAFGHHEADVRRAVMLESSLDRVAVLARHHRLADAKFALLSPIQAMLAQPIEAASDASLPAFAEPKLDGIRAQIHKRGDVVRIFSRTGERIDESFTDVVASIASVPHDFVLDGEIVGWIDGRIAAFADLQPRLNRRNRVRAASTDAPAKFFAFDLLYLAGRLLIDEPYIARRSKLDSLHGIAAVESRLLRTPDEVERHFEHIKQHGHEGLVLKAGDSTYTPGKRDSGWSKLKTHLPTLDLVVTQAERGHGKRRDVLSDYTFAAWDRDPTMPGAKLVNIGKAYSGLTDDEIAQLTERFRAITLSDDGRRHRVEPRVVLEIAFEGIRASQRHASGFALRFPRIKRIRDDKTPAQADTLDRVRQIHDSQANAARPTRPSSRQLMLFD